MIRRENECVDCKSQGLPCIGRGCPRRSVVRCYCDKCDMEAVIYHYEGKQLCIGCIEETLEEVCEEDE